MRLSAYYHIGSLCLCVRRCGVSCGPCPIVMIKQWPDDWRIEMMLLPPLLLLLLLLLLVLMTMMMGRMRPFTCVARLWRSRKLLGSAPVRCYVTDTRREHVHILWFLNMHDTVSCLLCGHLFFIFCIWFPFILMHTNFRPPTPPSTTKAFPKRCTHTKSITPLPTLPMQTERHPQIRIHFYT